MASKTKPSEQAFATEISANHSKKDDNQASSISNYFQRAFYPDKSDKVLWVDDKERLWALVATIGYIAVSAFYLAYSVISTSNYLENTLKPLYSKLPSKSLLEQLKLSPKITLLQWRKWLLNHLNLSEHTTLTQWNHFIDTHLQPPITYYIPFVMVILMLAFATWYARRSLLIVPLALAALTLNLIPLGLPWLFYAGYLGYKRLKKNPTDIKQGQSEQKPSINKSLSQKEKSPLDQVRERRMSSSKRYTPPKRTK